MGSTNKTTNYELSQYIGTDKPSWLNDYNNDMLKIDTQMKANATAAGNAQTTANSADGKADTNTQAISTLNTQINTPDTGLAATVAGHTTDIAGINGKIGSTILPTTAQTLTGAVAELDGDISTINTTVSGINTTIGSTPLPSGDQSITGSLSRISNSTANVSIQRYELAAATTDVNVTINEQSAYLVTGLYPSGANTIVGAVYVVLRKGTSITTEKIGGGSDFTITAGSGSAATVTIPANPYGATVQLVRIA